MFGLTLAIMSSTVETSVPNSVRRLKIIISLEKSQFPILSNRGPYTVINLFKIL